MFLAFLLNYSFWGWEGFIGRQLYRLTMQAALLFPGVWFLYKFIKLSMPISWRMLQLPQLTTRLSLITLSGHVEQLKTSFQASYFFYMVYKGKLPHRWQRLCRIIKNEIASLSLFVNILSLRQQCSVWWNIRWVSQWQISIIGISSAYQTALKMHLSLFL